MFTARFPVAIMMPLDFFNSHKSDDITLTYICELHYMFVELRCQHGDSSLGISLPLNRYLDDSLLGNGLGSVW